MTAQKNSNTPQSTPDHVAQNDFVDHSATFKISVFADGNVKVTAMSSFGAMMELEKHRPVALAEDQKSLTWWLEEALDALKICDSTPATSPQPQPTPTPAPTEFYQSMDLDLVAPYWFQLMTDLNLDGNAIMMKAPVVYTGCNGRELNAAMIRRVVGQLQASKISPEAVIRCLCKNNQEVADQCQKLLGASPASVTRCQ